MSHRIFDWEDPGEGKNQNTVKDPDVTVAAPAEDQQRVALVACSDCGRSCSQYAEACPGCGRFFRGYARTVEVVPGGGWVAKVAWGIVLSSFLWGVILIGLFMVGVVLLIVLFGAGAALVPPQR